MKEKHIEKGTSGVETNDRRAHGESVQSGPAVCIYIHPANRDSIHRLYEKS